MTKYYETHEKQNVFDNESRSDSSFTVQEDTEVIHREVKGGTKTNGYLKKNQSEFSGTRRQKDLVKKHSEFGNVTLIDCTSEDGCSQAKLTCQEHVPERIVEQIIEVQVTLPILEKTVAEMKLAPNEHTQTIEFSSRSSSTRLLTIA